MTEYALVDTNVLIVASGEHADSPFSSHETPLENPALRQTVLDWLGEFEQSDRRLLFHPMILDEYRKKLGEQDYGLQVVMHKLQTCQFIYLEEDENGHAVIPEHLRSIIHDRDDRKWVAASLKATEENYDNQIVNACDTDWMEWEATLDAEGIQVLHIIEEWCRDKFHEKQAKKNG